MYGRIIHKGQAFGGKKRAEFGELVVIPSDKWRESWSKGNQRPPVGTGLFRVVGKNRSDPYEKSNVDIMLALPK